MVNIFHEQISGLWFLWLYWPAERRKRALAVFVGEVTDPTGGRFASKLTTPERYTCTALTTIAVVQWILDNQYKPGFQTPSPVCGKDFIMQFDGVKRKDLS
jgi:short subunit dehydrogenase-like uncharacterized protein